MAATVYPSGYGRTLLDIDALFARHHVDKMHPEYARRLRAWLIAQGGKVGIGGSWRDDGAQPDRPGFAPEGRSFHQYQRFASGLVAFCAVDLVVRNGTNAHRAPRWDEVPAQGGAQARLWGVHANVSSEAWHMQPIEIDGWASWITAGSPDPVAGYPLPTDERPAPEPPTEDGMNTPIIRIKGWQDQFLCIPISGETKKRLAPSPGEATPLVVESDLSDVELQVRIGYPLTPMPGE